MQAGEGGDELVRVAEQAYAVIVAEPPAFGQRVACHDLLEVLAVILDAEVAGRGVEPLPLMQQETGSVCN